MKKLLLFFIIFFGTYTFGQEKQNEPETVVEQMAEFPDGGMTNFRQLIANNFRQRKVKAKGQEYCELTFVIDRDGSIVEVKAIGTNQSFNDEAIKAITKIKTKWIPAKINNTPVRCRFKVPLNLVFN